MIALVTATVYNSGFDTACASTYWDEATETLEDAIEQVKENALEFFTKDYSNPYHVIINVNRVPEPEVLHTIVESTPEIAPVKIEVE